MKRPWWKAWLKRIRWTPRGFGRNVFSCCDDPEEDTPTCWCGLKMVARAGYIMRRKSKGDPPRRGDWVAYECPADRPWNFWRHCPWTTMTVCTCPGIVTSTHGKVAR